MGNSRFCKSSREEAAYFRGSYRGKLPRARKLADVVYIHGGSTDKLLTILHKYADFKSLITGKTIAGSSAGAYALATYGSTSDREGIHTGLGIVPIRVVCHDESETLPPNPESVEKLKNTAPELELLLLKDFESEVYWI